MKERVNTTVTIDEHRDILIIKFNENVELSQGDSIIFESYIGISNSILMDAYIIRKEKDAKDQGS